MEIADLEIKTNILKSAAKALNDSGLIKKKVKIVAIKTVDLAELFLKAVESVDPKKEAELPPEVYNLYNEIVAELEKESDDPPKEVEPEVDTTDDECPVFKKGWDETDKDCIRCKKSFPEDYEDCRLACKIAEVPKDKLRTGVQVKEGFEGVVAAIEMGQEKSLTRFIDNLLLEGGAKTTIAKAGAEEANNRGLKDYSAGSVKKIEAHIATRKKSGWIFEEEGNSVKLVGAA
jgi:hypothetical protein